MASLHRITDYLGEYLRLEEVPDYPNALNGLQLANGGEVTKLGAAVDASLPVVAAAVDAGVDLLLVHHGVFWQGAQRIEGALYRKLKLAMERNLAIYSAHIPLDVHPEVGNNALLAAALGFAATVPFFEWNGTKLGLRATVAMERAALKDALSAATGGGPVHVCAAGPETVREVGVITGGAGGEIVKAAAEGIDTFITGEGPHWSYTVAEELGVNVLYGGHYATETFGVKALAAHVASREGLPWEFIDHPTGM